MLKLYFNKKAMETLARELRRASWGAAVAASAIGYQTNSGLSLLLGGGSWLALQVMAFVLESIKDGNGGTP